MTGNNELAQLINVMEKTQAKMEESNKKVDSPVVAFQNLNTESLMENSEQTPPRQSKNDQEKGEFTTKRKNPEEMIISMN